MGSKIYVSSKIFVESNTCVGSRKTLFNYVILQAHNFFAVQRRCANSHVLISCVQVSKFIVNISRMDRKCIRTMELSVPIKFLDSLLKCAKKESYKGNNRSSPCRQVKQPVCCNCSKKRSETCMVCIHFCTASVMWPRQISVMYVIRKVTFS